MAHMTTDTAPSLPNCTADVWVTGIIVPGTNGEPSIRDDQGLVRLLIWGSHNTAVVDWGSRYRIGGQWFDGYNLELWACAGANAVIPQ